MWKQDCVSPEDNPAPHPVPKGDPAPHPVPTGPPSHPTEETHFDRLYPRSRSFGHYPKFMTIGEGRNVDRPVNRELCLSA